MNGLRPHIVCTQWLLLGNGCSIAVRVALLFFFTTSSVARAVTVDDKLYFNVLTGRSTSLDASLGPPPFSLSKSTKIIPTLFLSRHWVNFASTPQLSLNVVSPGFVFVSELNARWKLVAVQQSRWRAAEGTPFSWSKQVSFNGVYLASYQPRGDDRFRISAGLLVELHKGRTKIRPAGALLYESSDRAFYGELGFPYSNLILRSSRGLEYGLAVQISDDLFHVGTASLPISKPGAEYLRITNVYVGPTVSAPIASNTFLNFKFGANVLRSTQLADDSLNEISETDTSYPLTWFVKVGLSMRFGLKAED